MSFGDVRGHEATLTLLKERLGRQCLPHALLFYGPRGVGKQKVAWALAKALVCEKYPQSVCGCCPSCKKAQMKSHPDISRLEPEGKSRIIKIEHIREMKSRVVLKPLEGKSQVVILEEAHKMNPEAQNAFLKVLEEPPQNVYFVLLSPDPQALLPTVRSRCQKFKFDPLNLEDQVAILTEDCGVGLEEASELATISEGSMEKALQMREAAMKKEAVKAGFYETEYGKFPKIQILTIEDLFTGKKLEMPWLEATKCDGTSRDPHLRKLVRVRDGPTRQQNKRSERLS